MRVEKTTSNYFFSKIKIACFFLCFFSCLLFPNLSFASNANVAGHWDAGATLSPLMDTHTVTTVTYNGEQEVYTSDGQATHTFICELDVTQSSEGVLSGSHNETNGDNSYSQNLTGQVNGSSVAFQLVSVTHEYSGGQEITITTTDNFSGSVSGGTLSGTVDVSYLAVTESSGSNWTYNETTTGTLNAPLSFTLPNPPGIDTIITSMPEQTGTNREVTFSYEGQNGSGGIAGYYYQLDSEPQVYTTENTVTFSELAFGEHAFSVAAKDKEDNIDSTPATYTFTIIQTQQEPTENSTFGPPKDKDKETGDPINLTTGNMYVYTSDMRIPGKGLDFDFSRTYNSRDDYSGPLGYGWTHSYNIFLAYDSTNKLATIKDWQGRKFIFADNLNGTFTSQRGDYTTLTKAADSYIWRLKGGTEYYFDTTGKLTRIVDRNDNAITLTYTSDKLTKITDTGQREVTFTYDGSNRITSATNPLGKIYKYAYDGAGNLVSITGPLNNKITYAYNSEHNLIQKTLPNLKTVTFAYDTSDHCTSSSGEDNYEKVTLTFQPQYSRTIVRNSKNNPTVYYYNKDYQIVKIKDALGNVRRATWNRNIKCTSRTDSLGRVVNMRYDANGNLIKLVDPLGNKTYFKYEPVFSHIRTITDPAGNVTVFNYDAKGNLTRQRNALGFSTFYQYTADGLPKVITNSLGNKSYIIYDTYGNITRIKNLAGVRSFFTYDILGNRISFTDQKGNQTKYYYDGLNRLIKIDLPDKASTNLFTYDTMDNLIEAIDALGNKTNYTYNQTGKVETITDALGGVITYSYDTEGNLTFVKDQNNNATTYTYDVLNRLISKKDAANYKWQYAYDAASNRVKEADPNGQTIDYTYDELNRLLSLSSSGTNVSFTYDNLGRLTMMVDSQGATTYTYDSIGQLLEVDGPFSNDTITYTYDSVGNRLTISNQDGISTQYVYDNANRLTNVIGDNGLVTGYAYDRYGNLTSVNYPNNTSALYRYDQLNRLIRVTNQLSISPNTRISEYRYAYDALNRKVKMVIPQEAACYYNYDALGRLTLDKRVSSNSGYREAFTYDLAGNRATMVKNGVITNYTYNNLNQLTKEETGEIFTNYYYDNNGNLSKSSPNTEESTYFYYDSFNRLNKVTGPDLNETYKYDGTGNRIQIDSSGTVTNFLYDGPNAIVERNSSQVTDATYLRNPFSPGGIGGIINQQSTAHSQQYYHYNAQGTVTDTTNPSAEKLNSYISDAFGNIISSTGATPNNRQFLTKEQDKTGLIYFGKRYYDPKIGRFITPDPMGMIDGPNLYLYCNNDPVNMVDLWGLCGEDKDKNKWTDVGLKGIVITVIGLTVDDATVIGVADDVLIPILLTAGGAIVAYQINRNNPRPSDSFEIERFRRKDDKTDARFNPRRKPPKPWVPPIIIPEDAKTKAGQIIEAIVKLFSQGLDIVKSYTSPY